MIAAQQVPFVSKILLPQRRPDILRRQRLIDFLHQRIDRRLLLICAPAGYGKTTLLVDFAHDAGMPVCWYALDAFDRDPRTFFAYLIASLRQRFPAFGERTRATLASGADPQPRALVSALANELYTDIPEYFLLVLEDYQYVDTGEEVNAALDLLLRHMPDNCHVAVASRTIPKKLTLSRLAAQMAVAGVGPEDLRFTAAEAEELLRRNFKLELTDKVAQELAEWSEGWIAGILLSTHTLGRGLGDALARAKGPGRQVFDYLASEVFNQQPPDVQEFLLGSAILHQLRGEYCDGLLERADSHTMLERLADANLFLSRLEGTEDWYRYHHLFQGFLHSRLRDSFPDRFVNLHHRAASLALQRGKGDLAIQHYHEVGSHGPAAELMEQVGEAAIKDGKWLTLRDWLDALPEQILAARPNLLLLRGRVAQRTGEPDLAMYFFDRACAQFSQRGDRASEARALVERGSALGQRGLFRQAIQDCCKALSVGVGSALAVTAQAHEVIGLCRRHLGQPAKALRELRRALETYLVLDDAYGRASAERRLATVYLELGQLEESLNHYRQALAIWQRLGDRGLEATAANGIGLVQYRQGDWEGALATLTDALAKAREVTSHPQTEGNILWNTAVVLRALGRWDEAQKCYEQALEIVRRTDDAFTLCGVLCGLADLLRLRGELPRGERLAREALRRAQRSHTRYHIGLAEMSLGRLEADQGDIELALRRLGRASRLLRLSRARRDHGQAEFYIAQVLFMAGRMVEAELHLEAALQLAQELDQYDFLLPECRLGASLLRYAALKGLGGPRVLYLLERVEAAKVPGPVYLPTPVSAGVMAKLPKLEAYAFDQARVLRDGRLVTPSEWRSATAKEMFFLLLEHPRGLRKEQVIAALWPNLSLAKGTSQFHSTLYLLRRALHPACVVYQYGRYCLNPKVECWSDTREFERLLAEAGRLPTESDEVGERLRRAVSIYAGPYLEEFYSDWTQERRDELKDKYLKALALLADYYACRDQYRESIAYCEQILAVDHSQEEIHGDLMRYYAALGDRAAALQHYRRYAQWLEREIGDEPSPRLRALYAALLHKDATVRPAG